MTEMNVNYINDKDYKTTLTTFKGDLKNINEKIRATVLIKTLERVLNRPDSESILAILKAKEDFLIVYEEKQANELGNGLKRLMYNDSFILCFDKIKKALESAKTFEERLESTMSIMKNYKLNQYEYFRRGGNAPIARKPKTVSKGDTQASKMSGVHSIKDFKSDTKAATVTSPIKIEQKTESWISLLNRAFAIAEKEGSLDKFFMNMKAFETKAKKAS